MTEGNRREAQAALWCGVASLFFWNAEFAFVIVSLAVAAFVAHRLTLWIEETDRKARPIVPPVASSLCVALMLKLGHHWFGLHELWDDMEIYAGMGLCLGVLTYFGTITRTRRTATSSLG